MRRQAAAVQLDAVGRSRRRFSSESVLHLCSSKYVDADVPDRIRTISDTQPMRIPWTYASVGATRTGRDRCDRMCRRGARSGSAL